MKKIWAILVITISLCLLLVGCHDHAYSTEWASDAESHWRDAICHDGEKKDLSAHVWGTSTPDGDGNVTYSCSVCGYEHQHLYDGEKWEYNGREHWHPVTCGHGDAPLYTEEHDIDVDTGVCSVCACDISTVEGCEVAFAYYVVDENGNPVVNDDGTYSEVGVTYTSVERDGSMPIDTVNGAILYAGDKISFSVKKSVFCYYTDSADSPLVEVISGTGDGEKEIETVYPDAEGVYTVEISEDTIVSVANVATSPRTIEGKGTKEEPFSINSLVDWLYFAMYINDKDNYSLDYNIGYWVLNVDLDFQGESIYVIGDGFSSQNSVFCGNFDGKGHTISNFVLENSISASVGTGYSNYLGLFGVSTGYVGVDSVIANLNVENVTVNATAGNDDIVSAGCILGYGVGTNILNCTARNSTINVSADDQYMSFAGGIVGYLQSGMTEEGILFYSSASYSVAENLNIKGTGMLYSAGGIAGRVVSYNDQVTSFIVNCYSSGTISDAFRSGGIVGELQRYCSVQNSYSTASVSSYSSVKLDADEKFTGTTYDDRYSYAGGIVGFADNDTVVAGCFFDGTTYATAATKGSYAKTAKIVAGYSAERFSDYYAKEVVLNNASDDAVILPEYLQNELKWNDVDWTFGEGYPTINPESLAHVFTLKINIGGTDVDSLTIDSQYIPLSFWYVINGNSATSDEGIARYYQQGTSRTYGYFFDSGLTQPVPVGYVPMTDMTLYAEYVDTATIAGNYFVSNNGTTAEITISTDGAYTYEEGAILLNGNYSFDGEVITFYNSFFSRIASTATPTQKINYYTFWADLQADGNLHLYDCDVRYDVSEDNEAQNPTFVTMARFYAESDPLVIVATSNLSFTGGYYYLDDGTKHVFEFNNDFTGVYKKYTGDDMMRDTFTFVSVTEGLAIELDANGTRFTAIREGDGLVSMKDNRDGTFALSAIDDFVGTWEKKATSHKIYTFDGMGNWSYEHYVYLVNDDVVNATREVVDASSGTYTVSGGELSLVRDGINVTATVNGDGSISVMENGQPVEVEFYALNSYKGVWYTANNKIIRYTLTIDGMNGEGVGTALIDGFEIEPLSLRYTAVSADTLYFYVEDVVYAILTYDAKTGLFDGLFYDNATGYTTTPQTLYLYDDFSGSWVSDIDGISNIRFNGFGAYDTIDPTGNTLGVKGTVTIGNDTVGYTVDRSTDKAEFTYKGVKYVLTYNEYSDTVSVSYGDDNGTIAKADAYIDMNLSDGVTVYDFDGRGNMTAGGTVTAGNDSGIYKIQPDGNVLLQFEGQGYKTIVVNVEDGAVVGYSLDGSPLYVDNPFSGKWAIPTENVSIEVGYISAMPAYGRTVELDGKYNGISVTMYYNGTDTVSFTHSGKEYSLYNVLGEKAPALILRESTTINEEVMTESIVVEQDDYFGVWTRTDNTKYSITFDGCGASDYVNAGYAADKQGMITYDRTYAIVEGKVTIFDNEGEAIATFEECEKEGGVYVDTDGAYLNGGRYYRLLLK